MHIRQAPYGEAAVISGGGKPRLAEALTHFEQVLARQVRTIGQFLSEREASFRLRRFRECRPRESGHR